MGSSGRSRARSTIASSIALGRQPPTRSAGSASGVGDRGGRVVSGRALDQPLAMGRTIAARWARPRVATRLSRTTLPAPTATSGDTRARQRRGRGRSPTIAARAVRSSALRRGQTTHRCVPTEPRGSSVLEPRDTSPRQPKTRGPGGRGEPAGTPEARRQQGRPGRAASRSSWRARAMSSRVAAGAVKGGGAGGGGDDGAGGDPPMAMAACAARCEASSRSATPGSPTPMRIGSTPHAGARGRRRSRHARRDGMRRGRGVGAPRPAYAARPSANRNRPSRQVAPRRAARPPRVAARRPRQVRRPSPTRRKAARRPRWVGVSAARPRWFRTF